MLCDLIGRFRVWISSSDAAAVAEKGFRIVHAPSDYFYLVRCSSSHNIFTVIDSRLGLWCWSMAWQLYSWKQLVRPVQELAKGTALSHPSLSKYLWRSQAYSFDPYSNITESQRDLILGGQQLLWTEQSSPHNIDPIVWPRAAASAEVFWSGPGGDVEAALARLHDHAYRITRRGIKAIALQPKWCALRPGKCDLTA